MACFRQCKTCTQPNCYNCPVVGGSAMHIRGIELTVPGGRGYVHTMTKRKPRLSDGKRHPVTIIRPKEDNGK